MGRTRKRPLTGQPKPAGAPDSMAWRLTCRRCGAELPLLHPHIMVEFTDDDDELICHDCHAELHPY